MNVVYAMTASLAEVITICLTLYMWILIVGAVMSWLVSFNVINTGNRFVQTVGDFIYRMTEPLLRPIRRVLPPAGGLDLSPLILILIIWFLRSFIARLLIL